jgi:hypothetical protein
MYGWFTMENPIQMDDESRYPDATDEGCDPDQIGCVSSQVLVQDFSELDIYS